MGRPRKPEHAKKPNTLGVALKDETVTELRRIAAETGLPVSYIIRRATERYVANFDHRVCG